MSDFIDTSANTQDVADPAISPEDASVNTEGAADPSLSDIDNPDDSNADDSNVDSNPDDSNADPKGAGDGKAQKPDVNSRFAELRREREEQARQLGQFNKLSQALERLGYKGGPDEVADILEAQAGNMTVEQLREQRELEQIRERELIQNSPLVRELKEQNEQALKELAHARMKEDLEKIKAANPDITAKSVEEFGADFLRLVGAGVDPVVAYEAVRAKTEKTTKAPPPSIGAVGSSEGGEKELFSPDDVDALTEEDFKKHPEWVDKVIKSMTLHPQWRKK